MSILQISHRTTFRYDAPIPTSYNEARLLPAHLPRQRVLESSVDISPVTWQTNYSDYWDSRVIAFEVLRPHDELSVVSRFTVEVLPAEPASTDATWDDVRAERTQDLLAEYLANSPATEPTAELLEFAKTTAADLGPDAAARAICTHLHEVIEYVPGVTTVHTPASHAWQERKGVCQDFAHLALGALRSLGIPARYVSGYLHPRPEAGVGETVHGESHAWVEWWAGEWHAFDPTNAKEVGDHHVIVARAREYNDVMPMAGVFAGAGSLLEVVVEVTQIS